MQQKIKSKEGDVFLVPLKKGDFAIGLIVRKKGSILLGYFWNKKIPKADSKIPLNFIYEQDPILVKRFGYLGIFNGEWPIIGSIPNFSREEWSIPLFKRNVSFVGDFAIKYNDELEEVDQILLQEEDNNIYPEDGLAGHGWIEERLTNLIDQQN